MNDKTTEFLIEFSRGVVPDKNLIPDNLKSLPWEHSNIGRDVFDEQRFLVAIPVPVISKLKVKYDIEVLVVEIDFNDNSYFLKHTNDEPFAGDFADCHFVCPTTNGKKQLTEENDE